MVDIRDINDKIYVFEPSDGAPGFFKCFFHTILCSPFGKATLIQKVEEKDGKLDVYGTDAMLCNGCVPQSPCICTACCGCSAGINSMTSDPGLETHLPRLKSLL